VNELEDRVRSSKHTKLPIVDKDMDTVKGLLDAPRFIMLDYDDRKNSRDTSLIKPVYLPENAHAYQAMEQFRQNEVRMAMVVNEYGGIEGIVTMEDLLEEIVGEIYDEFDKPHWNAVETGDAEWRVTGLAPLEDLGEKLGFDFGATEADTLAGFVSEQLERIPEKGDVLTTNGWRFRVRRVHKRRIMEVDVRPLNGGNES
jgi:CBS domain containing-hemolysin-like protein